MDLEKGKHQSHDGSSNDKFSTTNHENLETCSTFDGHEDEKLESCSSRDYSKRHDAISPVCRVCQCTESDRRGDSALDFLNIMPPSEKMLKIDVSDKSPDKGDPKDVKKSSCNKNDRRVSEYVEFISPEGEIFICNTNMEVGPNQNHCSLVTLGCSCKGDLSIAHYACALKWFINHGSTICEICGSVASNIRPSDFKKVLASLKDYEALRETTATGNISPIHQMNLGIDPDAISAIRRQRLSEISLWFNPQGNSTVVMQSAVEQSASGPNEDSSSPVNNQRTKWAVEITGILVATGLLTVTLDWLIAPHVGKRTAKYGLHILLGGLCALTIVIFLRFIVLSRIKYGPARYWAFFFLFWFLVFAIWASRTHKPHTA